MRIRVAVLYALAIACLLSGPVHAEVKDAKPNGFTIENSQVVPGDTKPPGTR